MILSSISAGRLTPLGQMRACSNLFHLLRDAAMPLKDLAI